MLLMANPRKKLGTYSKSETAGVKAKNKAKAREAKTKAKI